MIDRQQILKWWETFKGGESLTEIRVLDGTRAYSGYFTDVEKIIKAIEPFDKVPNAQMYFILNHIKDACYGRTQKDKIIKVNREPTTGDVDVDRRTHVLIDLDPKRPAGVSSSNDELEYAHRKAVEVYRFLIAQGFSEPIICMSGNGYHVIIPCDTEESDATTAVIKKFLQAVSMLFTDDKVDVDEKVFNASRICKLYGVTARKGENTQERPWRQSMILKVPDEIKPTDISFFMKVASLIPEEEERPNRPSSYPTERFDLESFLRKHGLGYKTERAGGGTKYILDHCPFNDQHKHKDAVIFQRDTGAIGFICLHNSCSGKTWRDVRLLFEPDAYDRQYVPTPTYKRPQEARKAPLVKDDTKGDIWLKYSSVKKPKIDPADFIPSGITMIDQRGLGFKRGMVSVWTGFRGCGKTSLLNQLMLNAAQNGYKTAKWTGELTSDMDKQWMYLQAAGKQFNRKYGNSDYYYTPDAVAERIDPWMDKYMRLFNNSYGDNFGHIKEQIKKLKDEWGLDVVILDNLMVLNIRELDKEKYDRQSVLMQELEDLAKELDIHIHIVAHPHKSFGYLRIDNISGTGDIGNKADNVFILSRVNRDFLTNAPDFIEKAAFADITACQCTNVIEVAKFRAKGSLVDKFAYLWFEEESNRFKNEISESVSYNWNPDPVQSEVPFDYSEEEAPF